MRKRILITSVARFLAPIPVMILTGNPALAGATSYAVGSIADRVADSRWPSTRSKQPPGPRKSPVRAVSGRVFGASLAAGIAVATDAIVTTFAPGVTTVLPGLAARWGSRILGAPVSFTLSMIRVGLNRAYNRLMSRQRNQKEPQPHP